MLNAYKDCLNKEIQTAPINEFITEKRGKNTRSCLTFT